MKRFEQLWSSVANVRDGKSVSPDLKPLLCRVHDDVLTSPVNLPNLKHSLVELLQYLSGAGRTNANCWAVDLFFVPTSGSITGRNKTYLMIVTLCWR